MKNDYLIQKKPLSALVLFSVPISGGIGASAAILARKNMKI